MTPAWWCAVWSAAAWFGALLATPLPLWAGPAAVLAGWRLPVRAPAVALGMLLLASSLGARAHDGLDPPRREPFDGEVTLVGDPRWVGPSLRVDVRADGRRVEAWARGDAAAVLAPRLAGERVELRGRLAPAPADAPWLVARHVAARLSVVEAGPWRAGDPASRAANAVRRTIARGAEVLGADRRSLYLGLLLGDQRDQDVVTADDFAGSGLTHLLAVSGSNVAVLMALLGPLLLRMRFGRRLALSLGVLAFFALVTRFEPSVLRATAMAGSAAAAVTFGLEAGSRRLLPIAVIGLVLVDPLLVHSLGFRLSVAATGGIALLGAPLARHLPGPTWIREPLAVTVAAQAAVAPLLIPTFGGIPVASLPANLLAGPATGPVVLWGIPAGLVAGVAPSLAGLVHLPTGLLVGWVGGVARWSAALPVGEVRWRHVVVAGAGALVVAVSASSGRRAVGWSVVVAALAHPAVVLATAGDRTSDLTPSATAHVVGRCVVVEVSSGIRADDLLEGLRRAGVTRVDVVVAHDGGRDVAEAVAALSRRSPPRLVLAPEGHRVPRASTPPVGAEVSVGTLVIRVESVRPRLETTLRVRGARDVARGARGPPR